MEEYRKLFKSVIIKKNIKLHHVDKLIKSVYPMQLNDYLLSKIPNTNHLFLSILIYMELLKNYGRKVLLH